MITFGVAVLSYGLAVVNIVTDPAKYSSHAAFRVFAPITLVECLLLTFGWMSLLKRRVWAWRLLVWMSFILIIHSFAGIIVMHARLHGRTATLAVVFLLQNVLPLWVLLTDRPSNWSQPASPQSEIPNPQ